MNGPSLFFVLGALALVTAWVVSWPLTRAWRWHLARLDAAVSLRRARWNPTLLLGPLLLGAVVALAAVGLLEIGQPWACHCGPHDTLHLCAVHPGRAAELLPLAALVWLLAAPRALRRGAALARELRSLTRLRRLVPGLDDAEPRRVDLGRPNALTVGLWRPVVVVDEAWWSTLDERERTMVAQHERAHVARRDPLTLAVARALAALLPPSADALVTDWRAAAEHAADLRAARAVDDPLELAAFLVRIERGRLEPGMAFGGTATERRVHALLSAPGELDAEGDLDRTLAGALTVLFVGGLLGTEIHHAVERLLTWLH